MPSSPPSPAPLPVVLIPASLQPPRATSLFFYAAHRAHMCVFVTFPSSSRSIEMGWLGRRSRLSTASVSVAAAVARSPQRADDRRPRTPLRVARLLRCSQRCTGIQSSRVSVMLLRLPITTHRSSGACAAWRGRSKRATCARTCMPPASSLLSQPGRQAARRAHAEAKRRPGLHFCACAYATALCFLCLGGGGGGGLTATYPRRRLGEMSIAE